MKIQTLQFPFTLEAAIAVNQLSENEWNSAVPDRLVRLLSANCKWQCGKHSLAGADIIKSFLVQKWSVQKHYRQMTELWAFYDNKISNQIAYEWQSAEDGQWFRACGIENLEYGANGLIEKRHEYVNLSKILEAQRRFK
jgi:uncharacterized protein